MPGGESRRADATAGGERLYFLEQLRRGATADPVECSPPELRQEATFTAFRTSVPFQECRVLGKVRPMRFERALQKPDPGADRPGDRRRDAAGLKLLRCRTPPREARPWG